MRLVVVGPHVEPDTAPTGNMLTGIVHELARHGHEIHVIAALPWYRHHRIEAGWGGRLWRTETTPWGSITRVHPFPSGDKTRLWRRALGFAAFTLLVTGRALVVGGWRRRIDAVIAMSPPITLGLTAAVVGLIRRARSVFNVQDIFPDAAIETGAIRSRPVIAVASAIERLTYRAADVVTVLSDDMADNVRRKVGRRTSVRVIPNFVDTVSIHPLDRMTDYRLELGIGDEMVVMYAGNVGYSQSLELMVEAARRLPGLSFVINGDGVARPSLTEQSVGLTNLHVVGYQPVERLAEVLATGDVQVVPLRAGLARVSVPSKVYAALAAGRAVVAAIDPGTEIPRLLAESGGGVSVAPDDVDAFVEALAGLSLVRCAEMGRSGREWAERNVSVERVGRQYAELLGALTGRDPFAAGQR